MEQKGVNKSTGSINWLTRFRDKKKTVFVTITMVVFKKMKEEPTASIVVQRQILREKFFFKEQN